MRASLLRRLLPPRLPQVPLQRSFSSAVPAQPNPTPLSSEAQQSEHQPQQPPPPPPPENDTSPSPLPTATATTTPPTTSPPLIYPSAPSPHHTTLPTFLAHAARTNLDPSSTVYVGTHFEYTTLHALARYNLHLQRVGGVSDYGIDLLGTWTLPSLNTPLKVLAQCKAVQRPGPHLVRELEGAFVGAPAGWRGTSGVVGILVAERSATKGIREALARSRWPMGFVACSREGVVEQFLWNRRAEEEGLEGVGVGMRYAGGRGGDGGDGGGKELVLTWRGRNLPFVEGEGAEG
ncbi:hypothetical protein C8A01DRAFT_19723 [Parachaetomium inaequale]|uniref:Uncharacterized protein n=1 Tax=Parachaetomium inaequale TaxID=2588326 RepID=A0AAN6P7X2_9PEZI|nr:hypothetical protein C8A01DRAFT_19723 [Parachaetomium inaequale]